MSKPDTNLSPSIKGESKNKNLVEKSIQDENDVEEQLIAVNPETEERITIKQVQDLIFNFTGIKYIFSLRKDGLSLEDLNSLAKMWDIETSFLGEKIGDVKYNDYAYTIMRTLFYEITHVIRNKQSIEGRTTKLIKDADLRFMKEIMTLKLLNKAGINFDITTKQLETKKQELDEYADALHKKVAKIKTVNLFLLELKKLMDIRAKEII